MYSFQSMKIQWKLYIFWEARLKSLLRWKVNCAADVSTGSADHHHSTVIVKAVLFWDYKFKIGALRILLSENTFAGHWADISTYHHHLTVIVIPSVINAENSRDCNIRVILILMKVGVSTSTWFQNVPFCSLIPEQFLFLFYDHSFRCP